MSLIQLTKIPFRKVSQQGQIKYMSDLGNVRLIVEDVALLDGGPITVTNPTTGYKPEYLFSLNLPAAIVLEQLDPLTFRILSSLSKIVMVSSQHTWSSDSLGTITGIVKSQDVTSQRHWLFDIYVDNRNSLQGIIVEDTFAGAIPEHYEHVVNSTIEDRHGVVSSTVGKMTYGAAVPQAPVESFVASNEEEMLSYDIKLADRCYRQDLEIIFINTTGSNDSMDDWRPLAVEQAAIEEAIGGLTEEFDLKLKAQEDRLIGMAIALGS